MDAIEVTVTCGSVDEAQSIGRAVVEARLAACAQTWPVFSCYRWQGNVEEEQEYVLLLKTVASHFEQVCETIVALHSYDLPAIVAVPVAHAGPGYDGWLADSTAPA